MRPCVAEAVDCPGVGGGVPRILHFLFPRSLMRVHRIPSTSLNRKRFKLVVRQSEGDKARAVFSRTTMSEDHEYAEERAILILYATETGNSLDAAERIAREARRWHFHTRLASTDAYPLVSWVPKNASHEYLPTQLS
jgi:sulfite reductase alpha subunit-like flavoprotein